MAVKRKKRVKKRSTAKRTPAVKLAPAPKSMKAQEQRWQAEDDVRTLMRAEEIKKDRSRMSRAKGVARQQAKEAAAVANKLSTPTRKKKS